MQFTSTVYIIVHNSERGASILPLALYQANQAGIIYETVEFHLTENTQFTFYKVNVAKVFRTIIDIYSEDQLKLINPFYYTRWHLPLPLSVRRLIF
jgi:hypothetical protein